MSDSNGNYVAVLLEEMRDQNKAVLEAVGVLPGLVKDVTELKQDVAELKRDMKVVKAAVTDLSRQVADHETRLTRLEATP